MLINDEEKTEGGGETACKMKDVGFLRNEQQKAGDESGGDYIYKYIYVKGWNEGAAKIFTRGGQGT